MSGLSARTYSCGGDGDRFRGGGGGGACGGSDRLKNLRMPFLPGFGLGASAAMLAAMSAATSMSSSEGAGDRDERDERSEESSSTAAMLGCGWRWRAVAVVVEKGRLGSRM